MTMTVKLAATMEQDLRQRSAALGRPASELIREALQAYLSVEPPARLSAYAAGEGLFGKHHGPADLASTRKHAAADVWADKHSQRSAKPRRA
jgi:hypothetical protein